MKVSKDKLLILSFVALIVLGFIISYVQQYSTPSKAAGTAVTITMSSPQSTIPVNQDSTVTVTVATPDSTKKISGIDLVFTSTGNLTMTSATAPTPIGGGSLNVTEFVKSVTPNQTRLSYAFLNNDADLPASISFQLTIKGTAAGSGALSLDTARSLVVGNIASNNYDVPTLQPLAITFGAGGGVTPTVAPTYPPGTPTIKVHLSPETGTQAVNTPFTVSLIVDGQQAGQKISGLDIKLKFDPAILNITSVGEPVDQNNSGANFTKMTNTVNATTGDISLNYVIIKPVADLPTSAKFTMQVTGKANGNGTIGIPFAQVVGNIDQNAFGVIITPAQYTIGSGGTITPTTPISGNPTPTPTLPLNPSVTVTSGPTVTVSPTTPTGSMVLNLKVKFQGILRQPQTNSLKVQVMVGKDGFLSGPQTGTFTADANGIWSGTVAFNDVQPGSGYRIYVKGPKHLQKKLCDISPTETSAGTYRCADGKITLNNGQNSLDFSKVYMLVGDLPEQGGAQNGVVDSYDTSYIKLNLGSRDAKALETADLNLDGIVDTQDYSLVIAALTIKYDEL